MSDKAAIIGMVFLSVLFVLYIVSHWPRGKSKPESHGIVAALEHDKNVLKEHIKYLQFKNDELLMDNKIMANKVKQLESKVRWLETPNA